MPGRMPSCSARGAVRETRARLSGPQNGDRIRGSFRRAPMRRAVSPVLFVCLLLCSTRAFAGDDVLLWHQGRLLDSTDHPVSTTLEATFSLYKSKDGGPPDLVWTETYAIAPID